ncbi:MAG: RNA polymerase sigma factor [bacterium]
MITKPDQTESDRTLWQELARGSQAALSRLFSRYYIELFSYGLKVAGERLLVEDAIQDVFFTLWKNRTRRGEVKSVKSYLFTSLRREIFRMRQGEKNRMLRNRKYLEELSEFSLSQEEFLISEELESEQKALLNQALDELSPRQKEALYLRFYTGLPYEELAEVMSVRSQTARNHVFEALQILRKQFVTLLFLVPPLLKYLTLCGA